MIITSTLSNFFSNLKNHSLAKKLVLKQRPTKQILAIVKILVQEGYLNGYHLSNENTLIILLKYINQQPSITSLQQLSKPGKRIYIQNKWFYKNKTNELYILSTTQGFMTQNQALQLNLGGELICKIL